MDFEGLRRFELVSKIEGNIVRFVLLRVIRRYEDYGEYNWIKGIKGI